MSAILPATLDAADRQRLGRRAQLLAGASVVADSTQTLLCTYLSAVLLAGLLLNAILGWVWADPVAGLVIAGVAVKEGVEAWRGDACCTPPAAETHTDDDGCADDDPLTAEPRDRYGQLRRRPRRHAPTMG